MQRAAADDPAARVVAESRRDYDLLMVGAAPHHLVAASLLGRVLPHIELPSVIVRAGRDPIPECFERLLVPHDGSVFSRAAVEFAFAYAEASRARLTLLHVLNETRVSTGTLTAPEERGAHAPSRALEREIETQVRAHFESLGQQSGVSFDVRILASGDPSETIVNVARADDIDLLVLGAENKMLARPLFFGQGTAAIVERAECTTAVVVPFVG
ncbi:MAG TPA: universal stress protein [Gemmatimonadaceae bacterium]|nr:universal stress protein [Gemmatimonadaceae bacterium]